MSVCEQMFDKESHICNKSGLVEEEVWKISIYTAIQGWIDMQSSVGTACRKFSRNAVTTLG